MKLYLSGPMTGIDDHNFPEFYKAADYLRQLGHQVVNPAELDEGLDVDGVEWAEFLRRDIKELVDCEGVALLSGWEKSRGATLERQVAVGLGMKVGMVGDWLPPRVVAFTGYGESGKDTAAEPLIARGYTRLAFADAVKELAYHVGWSGRKDGEGRKLLEDIGAGAREVLGDYVWVRPVANHIEAFPHDKFVVTDMRYPDELDLLTDLGATTVRVVRPGCFPKGPSDTRLDGYEVDDEIVNEGTVSDLHAQVLELANLPS